MMNPSELTEQQKKDMVKNAGRGAGLSAEDEKDLNGWMRRADDINLAVKFLLSGEDAVLEGCEGAEEQEEEDPGTPTKTVNRRCRYSADYSRFDDDKLIAELEAAVDGPKPKPRPKTASGLAQQLMLEEGSKYKDKGNALYKKGKYREAVDAYTAGLTLDPSLHVLHNNRAMAHLMVGNWSECLEDCNAVLRTEPRNVKALHRRGAALVQLRRATEACEDLRLALKYDGGGNPEIKKLLERANAERLEERKVKRVQDSSLFDSVSQAMKNAQRAMRRTRWALRRPAPGTEGPWPAPVVTEEDGSMEEDEMLADADGDGLATATLCETLSELRDLLLKDEALPIYFRWIDGVDALVGFMEATRSELRRAVAAGSGESAPPRTKVWQLLLIRLCDLLGVVFQSEYNLRTFMEEQRSMRKDLMLVPFVVEVAEAHESGACSFCAIGLLAKLTASKLVRQGLVRTLSLERLLLFPHHTDSAMGMLDGALPHLLQILDNLLLADEWQSQGAALPLADMVLPLLSDKRSRLCRDSAAGAVLRLSAHPQHRKQLASGTLAAVAGDVERRFGDLKWSWRALAHSQVVRGQALKRIVRYLSTEVCPDGDKIMLRSNYAVEGLLAALHNCTVVEDPEVRNAVTGTLSDAGVCSLCVLLLRSSDPSSAAVTADDPALNIKARALGVLCKCASVPSVINELHKQADAAALLFAYAGMARSADDIPDTGADADPRDWEEQRRYRDTCAENAVSLLASLIRSEPQEGPLAARGISSALLSDRAAMALVLRCTAAADDKTAGNAALCISELARDAGRLPQLADSGCIEALLDLIKRKRAAMHDEGALRRQKFREEGKASSVPLEEQMRLNTQAQRNAAIGLARLAKDRTNRVRLSDMKGMEVLATTLKYIDAVPPPTAVNNP